MTAEQQRIIEQSGPIGSESRLKQIALLNLGERSDAACRAIQNRAERKRLKEYGFSPTEIDAIFKIKTN